MNRDYHLLIYFEKNDEANNKSEYDRIQQVRMIQSDKIANH